MRGVMNYELRVEGLEKRYLENNENKGSRKD
jgi:hypothetical protein